MQGVSAVSSPSGKQHTGSFVDAASSVGDASQVKKALMGKFVKKVGYAPENLDIQWKMDQPKCENSCTADCPSEDEAEDVDFPSAVEPSTPFAFGGNPADAPLPEQQEPPGKLSGAAEQASKFHSHCFLCMAPQLAAVYAYDVCQDVSFHSFHSDPALCRGCWLHNVNIQAIVTTSTIMVSHVTVATLKQS